MGRTPGVDARFHRRFVVDAAGGGVDVEYVLCPPRRPLRILRRFLARHCRMKKVRFVESKWKYLLEESKKGKISDGPTARQTDHPLIETAETD